MFLNVIVSVFLSHIGLGEGQMMRKSWARQIHNIFRLRFLVEQITRLLLTRIDKVKKSSITWFESSVTIGSFRVHSLNISFIISISFIFSN